MWGRILSDEENVFLIFSLYIRKFKSVEIKIIVNKIQIFQGERVLHFLIVAEVFEYCFQGEHW